MDSLIKNKSYKVKITDITHECLGVGRVDNIPVFIKGALSDELVEAKIIKINKSYAVGRLLKIIEASDKRITPFCDAYKRCGGCNIQHLSYDAQLDFKKTLVIDALKRIGKTEDIIVHDTLGMENPKFYRNKAQYPVGLSNGSIKIGFYADRTHEIIEGEKCYLQNEEIEKVRGLVKEFIIEKGISIYDEKEGKGLVRHVMARVGHVTGEVMMVMVINGKKIPNHEELVNKLVKSMPNIKSILLNINTKNTNVILGEKNVLLYGQDYITDFIGDYKFKISVLSFFQVNPTQTKVLYQKALEYARLTGSETVFDLYCGIGTISLFLSQKAKKVYGVEEISAAVKDAEENARLNCVKNVEFVEGKVELVVPQLYEKGIKADVVVVDPPRKGCDEKLLDTIVEMKPERIVYVSCNPATLARDVKYLEEQGFKAKEAQPVDMFAWTGHVECVVLMSRVEK